MWWSDLIGFGRVHSPGTPVPSRAPIAATAPPAVSSSLGAVPSQTAPPPGVPPVTEPGAPPTTTPPPPPSTTSTTVPKPTSTTSAAGAAPSMTARPVHTAAGAVEGAESNGVFSFLGIPYGAARSESGG